MILKAKCDVCGKEVSGDDLITDYDERHFCLKCDREERLAELKAKRDSLSAWIHQTHMKRLRKLEAKIAELEAEIAESAPKGE